MLSTTLPIGVAVSLLLVEITGLSAGGIITPAYVALVLDDPLALALLFAASFATWLLVKFLTRTLFLFGSRRFSVSVLIGVALSSAIYGVQSVLGQQGPEWAVFGFVIPGLIAHQFLRQGVLPTLALIAIAAPLVRSIVLLLPMS